MKKITTILMMLLVAFINAQPTTNPSTPPTRDAGDVISIFSDAYTDVAGTDFNPNWGQAGFGTANPSYDPGTGDVILAYPNFNYQGVQFGSAQDISSMENLHVDIWIDGTFNPNVFVISSGTEIAHPISNTGSGSWISVDIPVAGITGDLTNAIQFKFDNGNGTSDGIYLDNLYFWKEATDPATDATLSSLEVDNSTVAGFASSTTEYEFPVLVGSTTVPQVTTATPTQTNATTVITQATAIPGTATVVVTSSDGTTTKTYTIDIVEEGPTTAAPTPTDPASDVISLFSDAYSDINVTEWSATEAVSGFNDSADIEDVTIAGNATKKITFGAFLGVDFTANAFDASQMTHFHIDYWIDEDLLNKVFNIKWSNHQGGNGETNAYDLSNDISGETQGQWISLDIPLTDFGLVNGSDRSAFAQFLITSNVDVAYVDNIYLYSNIPLSNTDFAQAEFKAYPNPARAAWTIQTTEDMKAVQVYNIAGSLVRDLEVNASKTVISTEGLSSGVYLAKISNGSDQTKTIKLIKE